MTDGSTPQRSSHHEPTVPRIECGRCGVEHHIDATTLPEQGHCRECSAFLRRPTEDEEQQFGEFLMWKTEQSEGEV